MDQVAPPAPSTTTSDDRRTTVPVPTTSRHIVVYTRTHKQTRPRGPRRRRPRAPTRILVDFHSQRALRLGVTQIVFALTSVVVNVVAKILEDNLDSHDGTHIFTIGFAAWCPAMYIISGSLGIAGAVTRREPTVRALLGTSVMSCVLAAVHFSALAAAVGLLVDQHDYREHYYAMVCSGLAAFLCLVGVLEFAFSVCLAKLSGDHLCCQRLTIQPTVQYVSAEGGTVVLQHPSHMATGPDYLATSPTLMATGPDYLATGPTPFATGLTAKDKPALPEGVTVVEVPTYPTEPPPAYEGHVEHTSVHL